MESHGIRLQGSGEFRYTTLEPRRPFFILFFNPNPTKLYSPRERIARKKMKIHKGGKNKLTTGLTDRIEGRRKHTYHRIDLTEGAR